MKTDGIEEQPEAPSGGVRARALSHDGTGDERR
jgi:hypothetical protein